MKTEKIEMTTDCSNKNKHYSAEEDALIRKLYPRTRAREIGALIGRSEKSVVDRAYVLGLKKDKDFMVECSRAGQFKKGRIPNNKGKKWDEYLSKEQQEKVLQTTYRKGHMPHNHVPVGTEAKTADGYWKVKVAEPNKWEFIHLRLWEQHHGKVPKGMLVYFKDGNQDNVVIENLAMTDRAGHGYRTIQNRPMELKQLYQLKGALKRQLNKIGDSNENNR